MTSPTNISLEHTQEYFSKFFINLYSSINHLTYIFKPAIYPTIMLSDHFSRFTNIFAKVLIKLNHNFRWSYFGVFFGLIVIVWIMA